MFKMERKYRYLFTLCLIMGFQVHVPVTTHPAVADLHSSLGPADDLYTDRDVAEIEPVVNVLNGRDFNARTNSASINVASNSMELTDGYISTRVVEDVTPTQRLNEQQKYNSRIDTLTKEHNPQNDGINQAGPAEQRGFNSARDLQGLEGSLDLNQPKSSQSDFNRLSSDLVGVRLKQIETKLNNISGKLAARRKMINREKHQTIRESVDPNYPTLKQSNTNRQISDSRVHVKNDTKTEQNSKSKVVDGIVWSDDLERRCPAGFSDSNYIDWTRKIATNDVIKMEEGCGSMQNRLVTFNDSTQACVRYRMNTELMQGDIYSFYLGKLLNQRYSPPSALVMPIQSEQWSHVKRDAGGAGWTEHKPAIISQYIPDLGHVFMPHELRNEKSQLRPLNYWFENRPTGELCELVQWTDLVVFDYICGNLDRVVNNLFNLKWNSHMLEKPIHNLMKIKTSGLFLFLDNESGLFHGYRLLDSYTGYHKKLLESVCVFRKSTADAIERLHRGGNAGEELQNLYQMSEQFHGSLPRMSRKNMQILQDRIADVYKHIQLCKNNFTGVYSDR